MQGFQAWDRYAYANNSPFNYTDPSGHFAIAIPLLGAIVIAPVVITIATFALITVAAIVTAILIVEVAEIIIPQFTPPMEGAAADIEQQFSAPMDGADTDVRDTFTPPMESANENLEQTTLPFPVSSDLGIDQQFTPPMGEADELLPQVFTLNIDPDKPLNQYVPGSIRREIKSYLQGLSYNEIISEIKEATGTYLKDLRQAKKIIEQMPRLLDKPKRE